MFGLGDMDGPSLIHFSPGTEMASPLRGVLQIILETAVGPAGGRVPSRGGTLLCHAASMGIPIVGVKHPSA